MLIMENSEEVMQILERYTKLKQKDIPKELEEYLCYVAKTGDTVYRWSNIKYLFREKLMYVIKDFHDNTPSVDDLPQYPNVDPFNYETMKSALLERFELFHAAPFTIQRLCELLTDPRKQYSRVDKYMRALEKNILVDFPPLVVSTIEPGRKQADSENGDSLDSVVNGDLSLDVNVDIDMENESIFNIEPPTTSNASSSSNSVPPPATTKKDPESISPEKTTEPSNKNISESTKDESASKTTEEEEKKSIIEQNKVISEAEKEEEKSIEDNVEAENKKNKELTSSESKDDEENKELIDHPESDDSEKIKPPVAGEKTSTTATTTATSVKEDVSAKDPSIDKCDKIDESIETKTPDENIENLKPDLSKVDEEKLLLPKDESEHSKKCETEIEAKTTCDDVIKLETGESLISRESDVKIEKEPEIIKTEENLEPVTELKPNTSENILKPLDDEPNLLKDTQVIVGDIKVTEVVPAFDVTPKSVMNEIVRKTSEEMSVEEVTTTTTTTTVLPVTQDCPPNTISITTAPTTVVVPDQLPPVVVTNVEPVVADQPMDENLDSVIPTSCTTDSNSLDEVVMQSETDMATDSEPPIKLNEEKTDLSGMDVDDTSQEEAMDQ